MTITEHLLATDSLQAAVVLLKMLSKRKHLETTGDEELKDIIKNITPEDTAKAMFHLSGLYHAYRCGLKHGRDGAPLNTAYLDSMIGPGAELKEKE